METTRTFDALDRCDAACSAQAYYAVTSPESGRELLFCAHHQHKYEDRLVLQGWEIVADLAGLERIAVPAKVNL